MKYSTKFFLIFSLTLSVTFSYSFAYETNNIPHVNNKAQDSYQFDYKYAQKHRAFAIAPGGAWSWKSGHSSIQQAKKDALDGCQKYSRQKCMLYAVDDNIVLNQHEWIQSWGPYKTTKQASSATTGTKPGDKFHNLLFTDPRGSIKSISELKGNVVFVHFWGVWCPSCRYEFTTLIDTYQILKDTLGNDIEFVVLQVREPIENSRKWAEEHNFTALPLSNSGIKSDEDDKLTLKDGSKIKDRLLARVFPASYVLDKNGVVVFSHMGSIKDWTEYVPFFKDVVDRSKYN